MLLNNFYNLIILQCVKTKLHKDEYITILEQTDMSKVQ